MRKGRERTQDSELEERKEKKANGHKRDQAEDESNAEAIQRIDSRLTLSLGLLLPRPDNSGTSVKSFVIGSFVIARKAEVDDFRGVRQTRRRGGRRDGGGGIRNDWKGGED
jgi:hypothetical protein